MCERAAAPHAPHCFARVARHTFLLRVALLFYVCFINDLYVCFIFVFNLQHSTQGSSTLNPQLHGTLDSNMRPWFKNASAYFTSTCLSHSNVPIPHQHAYPIPTLHPAVLNPQLHGTLDSNMRPWFQNASAYSTSTCVSNFSMPIPLQHTALLRVALLLGVYV
jgi:phosphoribosyl 1,2-cyclic phosphodiesterase